MLKLIAAAGLGAMIALSSFAGSAQTTVAPGAHASQVHRPTRSYRSESRRRHNMSRERARASAEHTRQMRNQ